MSFTQLEPFYGIISAIRPLLPHLRHADFRADFNDKSPSEWLSLFATLYVHGFNNCTGLYVRFNLHRTDKKSFKAAWPYLQIAYEVHHDFLSYNGQIFCGILDYQRPIYNAWYKRVAKCQKDGPQVHHSLQTILVYRLIFTKERPALTTSQHF
jgi:hypothetical protein